MDLEILLDIITLLVSAFIRCLASDSDEHSCWGRFLKLSPYLWDFLREVGIKYLYVFLVSESRTWPLASC